MDAFEAAYHGQCLATNDPVPDFRKDVVYGAYRNTKTWLAWLSFRNQNANLLALPAPPSLHV